MIRILCWTLGGAAAGAGLLLLGAVVFVELLQPVLLPPQPGEGFNALGFVLYLFGGPCGAVLGGTAGLVWALYRWRQPGGPPANVFAYLFSLLAAVCVLCLLLLVASRGEQVKPLGWVLLGGLTADAVVGAATCFWLGTRSTTWGPAEPSAADRRGM